MYQIADNPKSACLDECVWIPSKQGFQGKITKDNKLRGDIVLNSRGSLHAHDLFGIVHKLVKQFKDIEGAKTITGRVSPRWLTKRCEIKGEQVVIQDYLKKTMP
jgi:hypothetical protein